MGLGRVLGAAALAASLVLPAACTPDDQKGTTGQEGPGGPRTSAAAGSASPDAPTTSPTRGSKPSGSPSVELDPDHVVEPPGKRTGAIALADILVTAADTLGEETVEAIRGLKGVQGVELLSMAQVTIENEAFDVAAVDPATYRNYTPYASAETQAVWERVAAGELAVRPKLQRKLPVDERGFLKLGPAEEAAEVHVGAWAEQAVQIDAVVNQTWVEELEMVPGNALLVRTGQTAPQSLRKPIERIVDGVASVQMVDAVARYGLDTDVMQTAVVVGTVADAVGVFRYTVLGGGRIAPEPAWVREHIATEQIPILGTVTCNKLMMPQLRAVFQEIVDRGLGDKIYPEQYAGCYYPRFIAGTTSLSNHSFGTALDINTAGNQRGVAGEIDRTVVSIFKKWGFAWGGDWRWTDPMHFEMDRLVNPK